MMKVFGPKELHEDVQKKDLCIGCGACVELCRYFRNYKGKTAMIFPCTLPQGRCYAHCPKAEVDFDFLASKYWGEPYEGRPLGKHLEVRAAKAGDRMDQGTFQGGGTVSALLTLAMETGLIDAAALTDREGLVPIPRLVTGPEEVVKCASSKYMASPTLAGFNLGVRKGYGRIAVVGTPCQVTAVAQMRANPLGKEDFNDPVALVIGLFCNWGLDTRKLIALLTEKMDISTIQGMDIPPPPAEVLILETANGEVKIPLEEIRPLVPNSCHICPDMTSEWADISVGMFEGRPGWNTLIIRTSAGLKLVDQACQSGFLITEKMPEPNLDHLIEAASNKKKKALLKAQKDGVLNTKQEDQRSAIRMRAEVIERITA